MKLFKGYNPAIFLLSALIYFGVFVWVNIYIPQGILRVIRLEQIYGLVATAFLYLVIVATPFVNVFPHSNFAQTLFSKRKSLSFAVIFFAAMHMFINFSYQLGGFTGIFYLGTSYLSAVACGLAAFLFLFAYDFIPVVFKTSKKFAKIINGLVYLSGILILVHILMLGTHFADLSALIPQIFFIALAFFVTIEVYEHFPNKYVLAFLIIASFGIFIYLNFINDSFSFGIHSDHLHEAIYDNYMQPMHVHE